MTATTVRVQRSGPAVRAALLEFAPDEAVAFEEQFRQALLDADRSLDLGPVEAVLDRWWGIAAIRANPLSPRELAQVARARAGDDTGWSIGPVGAGTMQ